MSGQKIVILDGCGLPDRDLAPILGGLSDVLRQDGSEIETFPLHEMKLAHCLGCFGCWLKTPGMCVEDDDGRRIARAVIQSDTTVFFTPVTFGGYSPDLKKMMDHCVQLISPYFQMDHGEVHHAPRYAHRPRLVVVGVQRQPNPREAHIFRTLVGRNAINLLPPSYAAEVVVATTPAETLHERFEALLARSDALPFGEAAASLMPPVVSSADADRNGPKRALLIVGSPRTNAPSTSSVLGGYLLERLGGRGWETESLTLRASLNREEGGAALIAAADRAGLILFVFPLYADALPHLATKALSVIAAHRRAATDPPPQRLMAIVNSGFPETHQNAVALAICQEFAAQSGMEWSGGLALGGGGMIGSQPLTAAKRPGPPVKHVIGALDLAAAALSEGRPVPAEAVRLMTKNPIPFFPFALWRSLYMRLGSRAFEQEAAKNGVAKDRLLAQPYAA
ncbi:MAG TPA: NAD(P)H-dependent oxidoreductase [Bryobacteraceae bacterium]|nr:NAD(P)H-dependent oxidoreductase [Bryobacteraceae bacterium]